MRDLIFKRQRSKLLHLVTEDRDRNITVRLSEGRQVCRNMQVRI